MGSGYLKPDIHMAAHKKTPERLFAPVSLSIFLTFGYTSLIGLILTPGPIVDESVTLFKN